MYNIYHSLYLYIITRLLHAKVEKAWFFFSGWIWQDSVPTGPIGIGDLSCKRVFRFLFTCHQASQLIQFPEWLAEVVVVDFRNRIVCQILNNLNQTNSGKNIGKFYNNIDKLRQGKMGTTFGVILTKELVRLLTKIEGQVSFQTKIICFLRVWTITSLPKKWPSQAKLLASAAICCHSGEVRVTSGAILNDIGHA